MATPVLAPIVITFYAVIFMLVGYCVYKVCKTPQVKDVDVYSRLYDAEMPPTGDL